MKDEAVIPLSRWRAALARARRGGRADALLSEPDAKQLVPHIPVQDLYYAISEVGLADAYELVALATPEQLRGLVDLDVWNKDQLDETRMDAWLEALAEAGPEKLASVLEELDGELVALWLQRHAHVYDLTLDEVPEEPEGQFYPTHDRFFLLDILGTGEAGKALERLIDWIYRADLSLARRIMMSARWEQTADLEEHSYRWRTGRMADLGYAEYYDALGVYRFLDPATVKVDEGTQQPAVQEPFALPTQLAAALDERALFGRALGTLVDEKIIERLQGHLMVLVNRVMAAERVPLSDMTGAQAALSRAVGYLDLGLEYLSKGDVARAGRALETVALERIFRVGLSLTLQLGRLGRTLYDKGRVRAPHIMLDPPFEAFLEALRLPRPLFALDGEARPFRTLVEVARAAAAVEEAAEEPGLIYEGLGVPPAEAAARIGDSAVPDDARFGTLARTLAAHLVLGEPATLIPLSAPQLASVARATPEARQAAWAELRTVALAHGAKPETVERWLSRWRPLLDTPSDVSAVLVRLLR